MTRASRISRGRILAQLKLAARRGDRGALALAVDQMRTWAYSPRYWEKYLELLAHPLARLVDLAVIKQGEKIARQKGWTKTRSRPAKRQGRGAAGGGRPARGRARPRRPAAADQPSLFPEL